MLRYYRQMNRSRKKYWWTNIKKNYKQDKIYTHTMCMNSVNNTYNWYLIILYYTLPPKSDKLWFSRGKGLIISPLNIIPQILFKVITSPQAHTNNF